MALGVIFIMMTVGCGQDPPGPVAVIEQPEHAVVRIQAEVCSSNSRFHATGIAVAKRIVATVAHTFDNVETAQITDSDDQQRDVEIVWLDRERDLALLRVETDLPLWLPLGEAEDGEAVSIITAQPGQPIETKPAIVLRHVTATIGGAGERDALEIAAEIARGDSGAPVMTHNNEVAGVVFATVSGEDRGWSIAAQEIRAALTQPKDGPISLNCVGDGS